MADVTQKLTDVFSEILEIPASELSDASSPETTDGWDSAKSMEIVVYLEDLYGVQFSAEEIITMMSIGDVRKLLLEKGLKVE